MFTLIIEDRTGNVVDEFSFEQGSYSLGRVDGNDIILQSNSVSRQHARIFVTNGRCFIEDLGSSNGVIFNGERIKTRTELTHATRVQLGDFILYLEISKGDRAGGGAGIHTHVVNTDTNAFKLVRVGDMFAGEEFSLTEELNSIGRTDENFILLSDQSISRKHAVLQRQGDTYTIQDLGSSNGTRLNGKAVKKPAPLRAGDEVQFGNVRFVFAPGNQPVDLNAYATPAHRPQGTTLILGIILVLLLGVAIAFVIYFFVLNRAPKSTNTPSPEATEDLDATTPDDATSPDDATPPPDASPDPTAIDLDTATTAAAIERMIFERQPQAALEALSKLTPDVLSNPRFEALKARAMLMDAERKTFENAMAKQKDNQLASARDFLITIHKDSAYFDDAQRELVLINPQLANHLYDSAKQQCAAKLDEACIDLLCKPLSIIPDHPLSRKMLSDLQSDKKLAKPLKQKIQDCFTAYPTAEPPAPEPPKGP